MRAAGQCQVYRAELNPNRAGRCQAWASERDTRTMRPNAGGPTPGGVCARAAGRCRRVDARFGGARPHRRCLERRSRPAPAAPASRGCAGRCHSSFPAAESYYRPTRHHKSGAGFAQARASRVPWPRKNPQFCVANLNANARCAPFSVRVCPFRLSAHVTRAFAMASSLV